MNNTLKGKDIGRYFFYMELLILQFPLLLSIAGLTGASLIVNKRRKFAKN